MSRRLLVGGLLLLLCSDSQAQEKVSAEQAAFFENRIRPVLTNHCHSCHSASALGGLRLDSREAVLKGGKSGPSVISGKPEESLMVRAIRHQDDKLKMPLGGKLKDSEIEDIIQWIKRGIPWPQPSQSSATQLTKEFITTERKAFWSFRPIEKVHPPEVRRQDWIKAPIDRFVLARLESEGMQPVRQADKRTLIRRASLDLTGLPPTPEEVDAFLKDESVEAFAKVANRLLASPHYGERWARHWLDIMRYGETDVRGAVPSGYESYPNAYRYRDWVIEAFNKDLPYSLFIKAHLAGDLLPENEKYIAATGWYGLGPWYFDLTEPAIARADERHDRIDTLGRSFLGLTTGCARCHDHKYDPITTQDYYALAGVFASSVYHEYPLASKEAVQEYRQHQKKIKQQEDAIQQFIDDQGQQLGEILAHQTARYLQAAARLLRTESVMAVSVAKEEALDRVTLSRWVKYLKEPHKEHPYLQRWDEWLQTAGSADQLRSVASEFQQIVLAVIADKKAIDEENRRIATKTSGKLKSIQETPLPNDFTSYEEFCPNCDVERKPMDRQKFALWSELFMEQPDPFDSSKKELGVLQFKGEGLKDERLEHLLLSEWKTHLVGLRDELEAMRKSGPRPYPFLHGMADSVRPANARTNLRGNPYSLGEEVPRRFLQVLSEAEPQAWTSGSGRRELAEAVASHPLAARVLVNRVWQHHFGRGIVGTPSNFGQVGERPSHPELLEYLAAWFVESGYSIKVLHREILLSATYQLSSDNSEANAAKDAGNSLLWRANRRRLNAEALRDSMLFVAGTLDSTVGGPSWPLNSANNRRTVYAQINRFRLDEFLSLFDFPDPSISNEQRSETTVPVQRLFLMNSDLMCCLSEALTGRLDKESKGDATTWVRRAYQLLYSRPVTDPELGAGLRFLRDSRGRASGSARQRYARVLLSSNEFLFVY